MKQLTRDQLQSRKEKAVWFVRDVLGDEERASEIEAESPEEYAARKRLKITNPTITIIRLEEGSTMPTKAELDQLVDEVQDTLEEAYHTESSREELAKAVGDALDKIEEVVGEAEEEDEEEEEEFEPHQGEEDLR